MKSTTCNKASHRKGKTGRHILSFTDLSVIRFWIKKKNLMYFVMSNNSFIDYSKYLSHLFTKYEALIYFLATF